LDTLYIGNIYGTSWVPAEAPVSIRPSWSWKKSEDGKLKAVHELLKIYYETVGRNTFLLLNVAPDATGHIPAGDSLRLAEFKDALDKIFSNNLAIGSKVTSRVLSGARQGQNADRGRTFRVKNILDKNENKYWATDDDVTSASLEVFFPEEKTFNRVMLQEYIELGQRIQEFKIDALIDGKWKGIAGETTIGYKRIVMTPTTKAKGIRIRILKSLACPTIKSLGVFYDEIFEK
jgi:alpha-L-fucosidase